MYITKAISINNGWEELIQNEEAFAELNKIANLFNHQKLIEVDSRNY